MFQAVEFGHHRIRTYIARCKMIIYEQPKIRFASKCIQYANHKKYQFVEQKKNQIKSKTITKTEN